jgi:hypothetical protein
VSGSKKATHPPTTGYKVSQPQRDVLRSLELLGKLDARDVTTKQKASLNALLKQGLVQEVTVVQRFGRNEIFWKLSRDCKPSDQRHAAL